LLANGNVLVISGVDCCNNVQRKVEIVDVATGSWTATGDLITARYYPTATLLPDGKVLVAGGSADGVHGLDTAELYNPLTGQWSATGNMTAPRLGHTATLLPNGKVLVAAGGSALYPSLLGTVMLTSAELYDPSTGSWSVTGNLNTLRSWHRATLLTNGKVLVAGGYASSPNSTELYDAGFEIPLLTLNSTSYCIGDPWSLMVLRSAQASSVQLLGVSNRAYWAIAQWGATNQDGRFSANGTIAGGTEGTHTLSVEISGIRSNAVSFAVSKCQPK
jgi:hypothetical protein